MTKPELVQFGAFTGAFSHRRYPPEPWLHTATLLPSGEVLVAGELKVNEAVLVAVHDLTTFPEVRRPVHRRLLAGDELGLGGLESGLPT